MMMITIMKVNMRIRVRWKKKDYKSNVIGVLREDYLDKS